MMMLCVSGLLVLFTCCLASLEATDVTAVQLGLIARIYIGINTTSSCNLPSYVAEALEAHRSKTKISIPFAENTPSDAPDIEGGDFPTIASVETQSRNIDAALRSHSHRSDAYNPTSKRYNPTSANRQGGRTSRASHNKDARNMEQIRQSGKDGVSPIGNIGASVLTGAAVTSLFSLQQLFDGDFEEFGRSVAVGAGMSGAHAVMTEGGKKVLGKMAGPVATVALSTVAPTYELWKTGDMERFAKRMAKSGFVAGGAIAGAQVGAAVGSLAGPVGSAVGGLVGGVAGSLGVDELLSSKDSNLKEEIKTGIGEVGAAIAENGASLVDGVKEKVLGPLGKFFAPHIDKAKEGVGKLTERAAPFVDKAKEGFGKLTEQAAPFVDKAKKTVEKAAATVVKKAAPLAEKAREGFEKAKKVAAPHIDKAKDGFGKLTGQAAPLVDQAKEGVVTMRDWMNSPTEKEIEATKRLFAEKVLQLLKEDVDANAFLYLEEEVTVEDILRGLDDDTSQFIKVRIQIDWERVKARPKDFAEFFKKDGQDLVYPIVRWAEELNPGRELTVGLREVLRRALESSTGLS